MTSTARRVTLVGVFLAAIVAANLSVSHWGPTAAIYNAFLFIGLDLTTRDALHDMWRGRLIRNMAILIVTGSALSYVMGLWVGTGPDVGRVALASMVAFGAAATADAIVYHLLRDRPWYERANQSNLVGAAVDSLVFIALWPFGWNFTLAFTLFAAKVAGGVVWSFVLAKGADGRAWFGRNRERYPLKVKPYERSLTLGEPSDYWKDEIVTYDPDDIDTYPSVCNAPTDVEARFGWTGGEQFTHRHIERVLRGEEKLET